MKVAVGARQYILRVQGSGRRIGAQILKYVLPFQGQSLRSRNLGESAKHRAT